MAVEHAGGPLTPALFPCGGEGEGGALSVQRHLVAAHRQGGDDHQGEGENGQFLGELA